MFEYQFILNVSKKKKKTASIFGDGVYLLRGCVIVFKFEIW